MKNKGFFYALFPLLIIALFAVARHPVDQGENPSALPLQFLSANGGTLKAPSRLSPRSCANRDMVNLKDAPPIFGSVFRGLNFTPSLPEKDNSPCAAPLHLKIVKPANHRELKRLFARNDYSWKTLGKGVPPLVLKSMPSDLDRVAQINKRKRLFFLSLLPMVLLVNEEIRHERDDLLVIFYRHDRGLALTDAQRGLVAALAREYRIKGDPLKLERARTKLLERVDIIPPSIVLAQAANESAYGTSRFAQDGNNLFGQWTFVSGDGLVPKNRPAGATYEVRRFDSPYDSVKSYMWNINVHPAYRPFRIQRARRRAEGLPLDGIELMQGLKRYSIRHEDYVEAIRSIIRQNDLSYLASVSLRNS